MCGNQATSRRLAISDGCDPILDREVNKFSTAVKSVHLHHLVLVEFDSSRGNRQIVCNLLRRTPLREQLQNLSLAWREQLRAFLLASCPALGFLEHLLRQGRGDVCPPFQCCMDGLYELLGS